MGEKYDAIVIGSGIGGAGISALLAHAGRKTLLLDKNKIVGGRCTSYAYKGFTIDLGVHLFGLGGKGTLGEICRQVEMPDAIEWIPIKQPTLRVGDKVKRHSRTAMMEMLPEDEVENLNRLFKEAATISEEELEQLWYVPLDQWVNRFTRDPLAHHLIEMIETQYFCLHLHEASTTEFIRSFREVVNARGSAYPRGGCIAIPKGYVSAIEKYGSEVKLGAKVARVLVEHQKATGVRLEDGTEYYAPVIVSNADIKATVLDLVGPQHFPADYVTRIKNLTYACHPIILRVALEEKITDDQLLLYMPDASSSLISILEKGHEEEIPRLVSGFCVSPTNFDPSLGPAGKQLISFSSSCYPGQETMFKEPMLRTFFTVFPQAEGKVMWTRLDGPELIDAYGGETGNIIGIGQTVDQIHERRPSVKSPLQGLYFSSAEAGGHGIGTELAASSALELFELLRSS